MIKKQYCLNCGTLLVGREIDYCTECILKGKVIKSITSASNERYKKNRRKKSHD